LEEDLDVPSLEEAARVFGTQIIRSSYNLKGVDDNLAAKIKSLRRVGDDIVKVTVTPRCVDDLLKIYKTAKETKDIEKVFFGLGEYSANINILANHLGSRFSYTDSHSDDDNLIDPEELVELYRFRQINAATKIFAVTGYPLKVISGSRFFNTIFGIEKINAVHVPIPSDSIKSFISLAEEIGIPALSITMPHTETVVPFLTDQSEDVEALGSCNAIVAGRDGWIGYNTNPVSFSASLLEFIECKNLRRKKITIIGAGGAAKAAAAEIHRLKGKALILNRTLSRARAVAERYRFAWAGLDAAGARLMEKYSDIIIQVTPVGMMPDTGIDPAEFYTFSGKEIVMDLIYNPVKTAFLKRASEAGCRILDGYDMLVRQLCSHYVYYTNKEFPPSLVSRVKVE
jgi:3-dehydroquinate dehydratase/shikimate dehydrogenase